MNKQRQHRRIWSQQEDDVLRSLVEQSADPDKPKWKEISDQLNTALQLELERNPKQCRERWYNSLALSQRETKQWDIEDDVKLIEACKKHGHRWSKLAKQFDHKVNDNRLKNHFYSTLRKIVRVINTIVKQSKKQYQNLLKTSNLEGYSCQKLEVMKEVSKLRSFQAKLLSKVFSLIDDKQQYKYQAKCSLEVEEVKSLNDQILDYMQDYVTNNNQFSNYRILAMIVKIMHVNRTIKTKYVRQVKLSIQDDEQIQKAQEIKKKRQKRINSIVKQELDNKIIPDRKMKAQIISKIKDQNKKLKKLMTPISKKNKKENKSQIESENDQNQESIGSDSEGMINYMQSQNKDNKQEMFQQKQNKQQYIDNYGLKQQEYDKVSCLLNLSQNQQDQCPQPANGLLNSDIIKSNNFEQNKQKNLHSPSFNFSSLLNGNNLHNSNYAFNNVSFPYDEWDKNSKPLKKELPLQQETKKETKNIPSQQNKPKQNVANQNPFTSNFLNDIPLFTSNHSLNERTKKVQQPQDFRQMMNPFFPQHKLTHSQGYFIFDPPQPEAVQHHQNDDELFKSNPILGSFNFLEPLNPKTNEEHMNDGQSGSNKNLRNSRIFQGLFASYNYQSNNDKGSEQSERMKNSLIDLIPNFHPMHTSAFCPLFVQNAKQNQEVGNRGMESSRPLSTNNLNDHQYGIRYNLMESQPIYMQMYRSSQLLPESNQSGFSPYRSYSYGQLSQQNRSSQSKKKKNE